MKPLYGAEAGRVGGRGNSAGSSDIVRKFGDINISQEIR